MSDVTFPYTGWILQPSFKPVTVELVEEYSGFGGHWHKTGSGKYVSPSEIYADKATAVAAGRERLLAMRAKIDKTLEGIAKKATVLDMAEQP